MHGGSHRPGKWAPARVWAGIGCAVLAAGLLWAAGCGGSAPEVVSKVASGDTDAVIAARGLTPDDVYAAVKTFVPTGQMDDYVMFASGGHSGQVFVIGVPSMRLLKVIGVFTPEPWQGWGYSNETRAVLAGGNVQRQDDQLGRHPPSGAVRDRRRLRRRVAVHQRQGAGAGGGDRSARLRDQADPQQPDRDQRPRRHLRHPGHRVGDRGRPVRGAAGHRLRLDRRLRRAVSRHGHLLEVRPRGGPDRPGRLVRHGAAALLAGPVRRRQAGLARAGSSATRSTPRWPPAASRTATRRSRPAPRSATWTTCT